MLIDTSVLPAFTAAAVIIALTPGSDTFVVLRSSIARGFRYGMLAQAGVQTGVAIQTLFMVTGLGILLASVPGFIVTLKYVGAAYLVFLGLTTLMAGVAALRSNRGIKVGQRGRQLGTQARNFYAAGLLSNLTNPKVLLFYLAFFPQFMGRAESQPLQLVVLAGIFAVLGFVFLTVCAALAAQVSERLSSPRFAATLDLVCGVVFMVLAGVVLFAHV